MPLAMEVGLRPGDFVLDGDPAPLSKKEAEPGAEPPILGSCLSWPNGWMDQDGTWHRGRPWSSSHCATWGHSSLLKKGAEPPIFGPFLLSPNGCMNQDGTWHRGGPWSKPHCARWGPNSLPQKVGRLPIFGPFLLLPNGWMHQDATWY